MDSCIDKPLDVGQHDEDGEVRTSHRVPRAASLLDEFQLLKTRSVDEAQAFYSMRGKRLQPAKRAGAEPGLFLVNGIYLPNIWFGYAEFGTETQLRLSSQSSP